ncbi:endonuclease III [candidate division WOR-3 bacterium]|nr:endonuclease III [candidate division WOR-3 bacterium]
MPRHNPYRILVSAVLSTRTQDPVTASAARRLFAHAPDAGRLARLRPTQISQLIYPVGFYRTKSRMLNRLGRAICTENGGRVPDTIEELLTLPGVGRKVANIVLSQAFGRPAIAVDTHVQRISNRLGLVCTTRPIETERGLARILPTAYQAEWNRLIVALGQTICRPTKPRCPVCPVPHLCEQRGVA